MAEQPKQHKISLKVTDVATGKEHSSMEMTVEGVFRGYCCCTNWVVDGPPVEKVAARQ
jgi:hypothetical protein